MGKCNGCVVEKSGKFSFEPMWREENEINGNLFILHPFYFHPEWKCAYSATPPAFSYLALALFRSTTNINKLFSSARRPQCKNIFSFFHFCCFWKCKCTPNVRRCHIPRDWRSALHRYFPKNEKRILIEWENSSTLAVFSFAFSSIYKFLNIWYSPHIVIGILVKAKFFPHQWFYASILSKVA